LISRKITRELLGIMLDGIAEPLVIRVEIFEVGSVSPAMRVFVR
jgi:hypothetical protein